MKPKQTPDASGKLMLSARVPAEIIKRIRLEAIKRDMDVADVTAEALDRGLPHNRVVATEPRAARG